MFVVRAIHTFNAEHGDELEFHAGENIEVLEKDEAFGDGWWRGRNTKGEEGLFPATYIEEIPKEPVAATSSEAAPLVETKNPGVPAPQIISMDAPPTMRADESESPKGGNSMLDIASSTAAAAATGVANVMGRTINEVQQAIENISQDKESDDEDSLGINQGTRAKLAEQAKLANEQRDKQRTSMGVTGLVYSDESGDEGEDESSPYLGGMANGNGNGSGDRNGTSQIPTMAATAIPLPTSPGPAVGMGQPPAPLRLSPADTPDLADRLGPALSLPSTPPLDKNATVPAKPPSTWNVDDVVSWAIAKGFDDSICQKFREHEITGDLLLELDANLLKELDIPAFGKRLRIAQAITELRRPGSVSSSVNQLSPRMADHSSGNSFRGMSAPPTAMMMQSTTPPLVSTPPLGVTEEPQWNQTHGRKSSSSQPPMEAIREGAPSFSTADRSVMPPSTVATSVPASPVTPNSSKRESSSSLGHKKKNSIDNRERLSFFGRNRKPAPPQSPGMDSRSGSKQGNKLHTMTPASPERKVSSPMGAAGTAAALKQIGTPDHSGHLKKKGETIGWKTRYFVLKGSHLYYLKSAEEDRIKGHIDLKGYRVIVDENANPGNYGFRLVGGDKPHFFSSAEQQVVREWMKALMKATIARDYSVAVTSSCNIPTIPLAEAQAMSPRPPSPASRDATQRANRRENTNTLTPHDANILMSLDTSSGQRRRASQQMSPNGRPASQTSTPAQDRRMSQASGNLSSHNRRMSNTSAQNRPLGSPRMPALIPNRPSRDFRRPSTNVDRQALLDWVNDHLPPPYPKASALPDSFTSGEVIFLLVRGISGIEPTPPVPPNAFARDASGEPGVGGLFAMMDILIDAGIDTAGVTPGEVREGDVQAIARLIESIKSWTEAR